MKTAEEILLKNLDTPTKDAIKNDLNAWDWILKAMEEYIAEAEQWKPYLENVPGNDGRFIIETIDGNISIAHWNKELKWTTSFSRNVIAFRELPGS